MGLNPNMDVCRPKKKCISGSNKGLAYDPLDPCTEDNEVFVELTCSCLIASPCDGNFGRAGGEGITIKYVMLGAGLGTVQFEWQAYTVQDNFILSGAVEFSTGFTSGKGSVFLPKTTAEPILEVKVIGLEETSWWFRVNCVG